MAVTAALLRITLRYLWQGQTCIATKYFEPEGAAFLTADMSGVCQAYWNHVKTVWRNIAPSPTSPIFTDLFGDEVGGNQGFGAYAIPVGEQSGLRAVGALGGRLPPFVAADVKFTVATRVTRAGHIRLPFQFEEDVTDSTLQGQYQGLAQALGDLYAAPMALGAPVALGVLYQRVVRIDRAGGGGVLASQRVNGAVVNTSITTQRSRKVGHGN